MHLTNEHKLILVLLSLVCSHEKKKERCSDKFKPHLWMAVGEHVQLWSPFASFSKASLPVQFLSLWAKPRLTPRTNFNSPGLASEIAFSSYSAVWRLCSNSLIRWCGILARSSHFDMQVAEKKEIETIRLLLTVTILETVLWRQAITTRTRALSCDWKFHARLSLLSYRCPWGDHLWGSAGFLPFRALFLEKFPTWMGLVRITSWYPNFNGSHFGLPPSEIHRMTGLPPKIVWTMTYSHRPIASFFFQF